MKLLITLLLLSTLGYAQSISKQVIGSAGKTQTSSNLKLSWSAGEPVVGLMTAGGNQLGNGYYPAKDVQALSVEDNTMDIQLRLYPNPTTQSLYVTHPEFSSFGVQIADLNGRQLYVGTINKEQPVDVSSYPQGLYLVIIENTTTHQKNTYKIIKK
jgi:hypothetical protein